MKKAAVALTLIWALLTSMVTTLQTGNCMPLNPEEHLYGDTTVYTLTGRGLNISITLDPPENEAANFTVTFTMKILEPFYSGGTINPEDYHLSHETLDAYLVSGAILDYDRVKVIDPLWIYWSNPENETYVEEERSLFLNSHDVEFSKSERTYFGSAVLPEISQGAHNVTVWVRAQFDEITTYVPLWAAVSETISFTIDNIAPTIRMLTSENRTFETSNAPLNFTIDESFSKIEYSLDGKSNVTTSGNTTLTGLTNGYHNVTVYATDAAGNTGASETLFFAVNAPVTFPVVPAAAGAIAVAVAAGLLLTRRKRRKGAAHK